METSNHPKWIIKYVHKSKINAVKIVTWEDHSEIATVPCVYQFNGEESEGSKAARLITAAPELLTACGMALDILLSDGYGETSYPVMCLRAIIAKATGR